MKGKVFTAQEVQAIIAGNKTMFREVIKPKINLENYSLPDECGMELLLSECPYQVGQKIFCKEVFCKSIFGKAIYKDEEKEIRGFGGKEVVVKWKPAQHMKQEHSRIILEITSIKVERLQDISEEDARLEGFPVDHLGNYYEPSKIDPWQGYATASFLLSWNPTHKKPEEKFEANPFVWVVDFKINK